MVELEYLLNNILPSFSNLVSVEHRNIVIYGRAGSGKTTLANAIVHHILDRYGGDNVNIVYALEIGEWYDAIDDRPVQVLIWEDATFGEMTKEEKRQYVRLRQILRDRGVHRGIVLTIVICHRLWNVPIIVRNNIDMFCVLSMPFLPFDRSFLRSYGFSIRRLERLDKEKKTDNLKKGEFYTWIDGEILRTKFIAREFLLDEYYIEQPTVIEKTATVKVYDYPFPSYPLLIRLLVTCGLFASTVVAILVLAYIFSSFI